MRLNYSQTLAVGSAHPTKIYAVRDIYPTQIDDWLFLNSQLRTLFLR
jgi:hypothetical protein